MKLNRRQRFLIGLVAIPIAFYLIIKIAQRPDHKPTFHAVVEINATVNGYPLELKRTINCQTFAADDVIHIGLVGFWKTLFSRRKTQWLAIPRAFGHVLPDGSSIMVQTPYACGREEYVDEAGKNKLKVQEWATPRTPIIGWSPDGVLVNELELYLSDNFLNDPNSRIQDFTMDVRLDDEAEPAFVDDFSWFSGNYHPEVWKKEGPKHSFGFNREVLMKKSGKRVKPDDRPYRQVTYSGFGGWVLNEDQWKGQDEKLDELLVNETKPIKIPGTFGVINGLVSKVYTGRRGISPTKIVPDSGRWGGLSSSQLGFYEQISSSIAVRELRHNIVNYALDEGKVSVELSLDRGRLYMRRSFPNTKKRRWDEPKPKVNTKKIYTFMGNDFEGTRLNWLAFYDPDTRDLYFVYRYLMTSFTELKHPLQQNLNQP